MPAFPTAVMFLQASGSLPRPRHYRLVDSAGDPHPVLDDLYDSAEAAWSEAIRWWAEHSGGEGGPVGIGMEVSTASGDWRTLRPPC